MSTKTANKEGAWRVTSLQSWKEDAYFIPIPSHTKRWLYDNQQAWERQLKAKKNQAKRWSHGTTKLVSEQFDGIHWVKIEEWYSDGN